jgi:hypothetical protein
MMQQNPAMMQQAMAMAGQQQGMGMGGVPPAMPGCVMMMMIQGSGFRDGGRCRFQTFMKLNGVVDIYAYTGSGPPLRSRLGSSSRGSQGSSSSSRTTWA